MNDVNMSERNAHSKPITKEAQAPTHMRSAGAAAFATASAPRFTFQVRQDKLAKLSDDPSAGSPTETLLRLLPGSNHCD